MQKANFPIEILIHDDASTDHTQVIIKKYADVDGRIEPILRKENLKSKGVAIFPILYDMAKGKYLALCEGDDYWTDPYKLQKQVAFLEKNKEYSFCFHDTIIITSHKQKAKKKYIYSHEISHKTLIKSGGSYVPTASILAKSKYLNSLPNWFSNFGNDFFLVLILIYFGKAYYICRTMSAYRFQVATESWSKSIFLESAFQKRLQHHKKMIEGLKAYNEWSNYKFYKYIKVMIIKSRKSILSDQFDDNFRKAEFQEWYNELGTIDKIDLFLIKKVPIVKKILNKIIKTKKYFFG